LIDWFPLASFIADGVTLLISLILIAITSS